LLRPGIEVLLSVIAFREEAGRLEDDLHAEVPPGERGRVPFVQEPELDIPRADAAVDRRDIVVEGAENGVVLEQVSHGLRVAEIVDGNELDIGPALPGSPEEVPPDAAEAVDAHLDAHPLLPG